MADVAVEALEAFSNIDEVVEVISRNTQQPSSTFMANRDLLFREGRDDVINKLKTIHSDIINTLRDQLFDIFITEFDEDTLSKHGFNFPPNEDPKSQLKNRREFDYAVQDIYNMGLSIFEKRIAHKLSGDLLSKTALAKTKQQSASPTTNIMDMDTKLMISKLSEVLNITKAVQQENRELKTLVQSLENKITSLENTVQNLRQTHQTNTAPAPNSQVNPLTNQQHQTLPINKRQPVYGNKPSNGPMITGDSKPLSLFVGGFNLAYSNHEIRDFVKNDLNLNVLDVQPVKQNQYNQSFRIDIHTEHKDKALDPNTWYEGLVVKRYRPPKPPNRTHNRNQQTNPQNNRRHLDTDHRQHDPNQHDHNRNQQTNLQNDRRHADPERHHQHLPIQDARFNPHVQHHQPPRFQHRKQDRFPHLPDDNRQLQNDYLNPTSRNINAYQDNPFFDRT